MPMDNGHLHDDKLFRAVNERLSDYETPYNGADWDAMSRSLNSLPKSSRFSLKFSLNALLVLAAIAGITALTWTLATGSGNEKAVKQQEKINTTTNSVLPTKQVSNNGVANSSVTTPAVINPVVNDANLATNTGSMPNQMAMNAGEKKSGSLMQRNSQKTPSSGLLFGDQIDRKKGFIRPTQENSDIVNRGDSGKLDYYYDVVDGQVVKRYLHRDTTGNASKKGPAVFFSNDSTFSSGAPTNDLGPQQTD
jgi:hypothetical protein